MQKQLFDHDINFTIIFGTWSLKINLNFFVIFIYFHQHISLDNKNKNLRKADEKLDIYPQSNIKTETKIMIPLKGEIDMNDNKKVISRFNNSVNKSVIGEVGRKKNN